MSVVIRSINLMGGAIFGQGMLFAAYTFGMISDSERIGYISTSLGIFILITMCVEYGGGVILRQFDCDQDLLTKVLSILFFRVVVLVVIFLAAVVLYEKGYTEEYMQQFMLGAYVGVLASLLNFTGFLDVKTKQSMHALFSGLHLIFLSLYLLTGGDDPYVAGWLVSCGLAITYTGHAIYVIRWGVRNKLKFKVSRSKFRNVASDGWHVLLSVLPGQGLSRFFGVFLLGVGGPSIAAVYNYLKLAQGLFNQGVTLLRRAEYPKLTIFIDKEFILSEFVYSQKLSFCGALMGMLFIFILFYFSINLSLSYLSVLLIVLQSLLWFFITLFFLWLQIKMKNRPQGLYGVMVVFFIIPIVYMYEPGKASEIIIIEMIGSISAFSFVYLVGFFRNGKCSRC